MNWLDSIADKSGFVYQIPPGNYTQPEGIVLEGYHVIASPGAVIIPEDSLPVCVELRAGSSWQGGQFEGNLQGNLFLIDPKLKLSMAKPKLSPIISDVYAVSAGRGTAIKLHSDGEANHTLSFALIRNIRVYKFSIGLELLCDGVGDGWVTGNNISNVVIHSCWSGIEISAPTDAPGGVVGNAFTNIQIQPGPISKYGVRNQYGNYNQFTNLVLWDAQRYAPNNGIALFSRGRGNSYGGLISKKYTDFGDQDRIL